MAGSEQPITLLKDVSATIFAEQAQHASVPEYVASLGTIYRKGPWKALIESTCELVGVPDPTLPGSAEPVVSHFSQGVDLGLRVVHHAHDVLFVKKVVTAMLATEFDAEDNAADLNVDRSGIVAATLIAMAHEGIDSEDPNIAITQRWEPQISTDFRYQHFFTHGFGFVLNLGHRIPGIEAAQQEAVAQAQSARAEMEEIERQLISGHYDWNKGLRQLGLYEA